MTVPASPSPDLLAETTAASSSISRLLVVLGLAVFVPLAVIGSLVLSVPIGVLIALVVAVGVVWLLLRDVDRRALAATGSRPLAAADAPRLVNLVEGCSALVGIASPDLAVVDGEDINVGVVGYRGPGTVIVTRGLLDALERIELEGVVARGLISLRAGLQVRSTAAYGLIGWLSSSTGDRLAGTTPSLDDEVVVDLVAVGITRYPPGLAAALRRAAAAPKQPRSGGGAVWMVGPSDDVDARLGVRVAALDEL